MTKEQIEALEKEIDNLKAGYRLIVKEHWHFILKTIKHLHSVRRTYKQELYKLKHQPDYTYIDADNVLYIGVALLVIEAIALVIKVKGGW